MSQMNMFEEMYKELPIQKNTLKLGTFFSGIGAPEGSLKDIGIDYDLQFTSEWQIDAAIAYDSMHNGERELEKIKLISKEEALNLLKNKTISRDGKNPLTIKQLSKLSLKILQEFIYAMKRSNNLCSISDLKGVDLPYCDMWFGGFPCQDISLAGNGKGFAMETDSRSSLGWEMIRLASEVKIKPRYIVFENVAAIFNNTHRPILNLFKQDLEKLGYTLYNKLLNAKNYGSPQNRNRYFLVAILGEYNYTFPSPIKLELRLKDLLEENVDEKYYLSDKMTKYLTMENDKYTGNNGESLINKRISSCITTREGNTRADSSSYICDDLPENYNLKILEDTKKGYAEAQAGDGIYIDRPHQKRGVVQKGMTPTIKTSGDDIGVVVKGNYSPSNYNASRIIDTKGIAPTVMENHGTVTAIEVKTNKIISVESLINSKGKSHQQELVQCQEGISRAIPAGTHGSTPHMLKTRVNDLRIRKLTPLECYRLQAFTDEEFYRAESVISNSQLYKTAGNSINRNVLKAIFKNLFRVDSQ